ncbi:HNH endonuclease signature motif containing protein [Photobacterium sp. S4TG1]|uniref:HNH endonuclease n=1 Tax=Photobacterium sp. S4TG1 TaxID=3114587 RepID=UPI002E18855D|nr:HNH endonuclease signature motif containing protein [Photobacterium sp. S4TG1]
MKKKVARICWNNKGWITPSGNDDDCKSKDKKSFEVNPGYGHEEWLCDFTKLIDGFKYSFIQGVNTKKQAYQGLDFHLTLYTVLKGKKLAIGYIKCAECLTRNEAEYAASIYERNGWFDKMSDDLTMIDANGSKVKEDDALLNFNIRFKPKDFIPYKPYIDISTLYNNHRYILLNEVPDKKINKQETDSECSMSHDLMELCSDNLSKTETLQLVNARIGQGVFRDRVTKLWNGEKCAVTLIDIKEILIASHIRPWRDCKNSSDRLDGANGLLLCAHIDKLFDQHLLSFELKNKTHRLRISKTLDKKSLSSLGIDEGIELNTNNFDRESYSRFETYMNEHFNYFLKMEV